MREANQAPCPRCGGEVHWEKTAPSLADPKGSARRSCTECAWPDDEAD